MSDLALAFLPLFVAVDVVGLLPIYLGWTASLSEVERRPVALEATLTATVVGVSFLLAGDAILTVLGVTVGDLQVAGGLLLRGKPKNVVVAAVANRWVRRLHHELRREE